MVDVRKMSNRKVRKLARISGSGEPVQLNGILGGALLSEHKRDLTYKMETMGCQMNVADSERMEGQLQALGIRPLLPEETKMPDLVVLNTCSIRDHAEQKVYS